jgi:recombinational DNA repair protein (RecF pathway)
MGDGRTLTLCASCGRGYPPAEMRPRGDAFVCGACADEPDLETVVLGMIGEDDPLVQQIAHQLAERLRDAYEAGYAAAEED